MRLIARLRLAFVVLAGLLLTSAASAQFTIDTVIGGGPNNFPGKSMPGSFLEAIASDSDGNVYFVRLSRVYKLTTAGKVFVVAGHGHPASGGDGGPAVRAGLHNPTGLALNAAGTFLFIADDGNHVIRRVDLTTGLISTVAGTLYSQGSAGDGGPATSARLRGVRDLAVDSAGNLFIVDGDKIRKVDAATQIISTIAGSDALGPSPDGPATSVALEYPSSVAVDSLGRVYIAEHMGHRIRRIANGLATTVVGTGVSGFSGDGQPALNAQLDSPTAVRVDSAGNLLICANNRVRKVDMSTNSMLISTVAGTGALNFEQQTSDGPALNANFHGTMAIGVDGAENFFVAEANGRIRRVDKTTATISTVAGTGNHLFSSEFFGDGRLASDALVTPQGVAVDVAGNIFVSDANNTVRRVDAVTGTITRYAGNGTGAFSGDGGAAIEAALNGPTGLTFDGSSNLYIADSENHRIRRVTPAGVITTFAGTGVGGYSGDGGLATAAQLFRPKGLAVDASGNLLIADTDNWRIRSVSPNGVITTFAGKGEAYPIVDDGSPTARTIRLPQGLAVDMAGNVFVTEPHVVKKISGGNMSVYAGTGLDGAYGDGQPATAAQLSHASGLALDTLGNLYIADSWNNRIRMVAAGTGKMSTVAGTGVYAMSGDGGLASYAELAQPVAVAVAPNGTLLVADSGNGRVRALTSTSGCIYTLDRSSVVVIAAQVGYASG